MSHKLNLFNFEREEKCEDAFWADNYPKLRQYCHFLTQNTWDGDDVAQETYLKALKYSSEQKMSTALLNKIAYHHWIDLVRKRKNESLEEKPETIQVMDHQLDDISNSVDLLLRQFTPKQAVIFLLKEAFQYQTKEIAAILGMTEMAVKSNLHRAKKRLEENNGTDMEPFWNEEEKKQLSGMFYEALKNQDPAMLVKSVPSLKSIAELPRLMVKSHSPSSTLCMAA